MATMVEKNFKFCFYDLHYKLRLLNAKRHTDKFISVYLILLMLRRVDANNI
jgi:hypothetical protein